MSGPSREHRLHLILTAEAHGDLMRLKEQSGATNAADVIRRALRIYGALLDEVADGHEIMARSPDGTLKSYRLLL